jgi:hypothetical protein
VVLRSGRGQLSSSRKSARRGPVSDRHRFLTERRRQLEPTYRPFDRYVEYTLAVQYETKAEVAVRVLKAIAARCPVSEHDAFQLRFWMSAEEALLPLDQIADLILRRESNSHSVRTGG